MVHRIKLGVNIGKFKGDLANMIAEANTPEKEKQELQVRIHLTLSGAGGTVLDTLSIGTMKELSGKDWVLQFEESNFATLC